MKKVILISVVLIGIMILSLSKPILSQFRNTDTIANKIGCRLFEFNSISINADKNIDLKDVVIKEGNKVVFANSTQVEKIEQEYGHTVLGIYHQNLLIAEFGHFKTNNWYTYDYEIALVRVDSNIHVSYQITGPNSDNDSFQKRYLRDSKNELVRIDYLTSSGHIYRTEEK